VFRFFGAYCAAVRCDALAFRSENSFEKEQQIEETNDTSLLRKRGGRTWKNKQTTELNDARLARTGKSYRTVGWIDGSIAFVH